ncbi:MAG: hypothetical protein JW876_10810 [Candidatus Krumholzibacteriota bacterium]|nr:hypothetical protein [Candidatus Krumholzibacteriota bacterium]
MRIKIAITVSLFVTVIAPAATASTDCPPADETHRYVEAPLDHDDPSAGVFDLYYELAAPFDPAKPTLIVVSDAQQFFVSPGRMERVAKSVGGEDCNVVGIVTRGKPCSALGDARRPDGSVDWCKAARYFSARQFVGDIDLVRRETVGETGRVMLYGASGGGLLLHQYVARHGDRVSRAWSRCAVMPGVNAALGIYADRFFLDLAAHDPTLPPMLRFVLDGERVDRARLMHVLQRVNFFVEHTEIDETRASIVRRLYGGDAAVLDSLHAACQCAAVDSILGTPEAAAVVVRLFELDWPEIKRRRAELFRNDVVYPELETLYRYIEPLVELLDAGRIAEPDLAIERGARRADTEMLILAGAHDHTVNWRSQEVLAGWYRRVHFFLADDNHMFMKDAAGYRAMGTAFYLGGLGSEGFRSAVSAVEAHRYRPASPAASSVSGASPKPSKR